MLYESDLDERSVKVLELRYGIKTLNPRTLKETGEEFGITPERTRQIQNKSLKKLKVRALKKGVTPRD